MARHIQPCAVSFAALCHLIHPRPQEPLQAPSDSNSGCLHSGQLPAGLKGQDLKSHIPKGEQRVAAQSQFQLRSGPLLSQLRRLRCPGRCRTRGWQQGEILPDPSPSPNFCALLCRSSNLCSSAPPTWLPPPLRSRLRNPSLPQARRPPGPGILPRLPRVPPPPPGFLSPRSGAPCQAHDVMVYVNQ